MSRTDALILRTAAAWTIFVWVTRIKNVFDQGRGAGFVIVHVVLALISIAFAVGTFAIVRKERGET